MTTHFRSLCLAALAAIVPTTAHAATADPPGLGLVGITQGQVATLSVVNTGATACGVALRIYDEAGAQLAGRNVALDPGAVASISVDGRDVVPSGGTRASIRPTAVGNPDFVDNPDLIDNPDFVDNPDLHPDDHCVTSLAVTDRTSGALVFALSAARVGVDRATRFAVDYPLVTPVTGQNTRLTLVNTSNGATCTATLALQLPGGRTLATRTVTLGQGGSAALETSSTSTIWGQVVMNMDSNGNKPPCKSGFEIYNATSGVTQVASSLSFTPAP